MKCSRILVTGGAGMIGSNLVKRLVGLGHDVTVIDNMWRGRIEYLNGIDGRPVIDLKKNFVRMDLSKNGSDAEVWRDKDYVFHLADVVAGIDYVYSNQGSVFRHNLLINTNVIDAVRKHPVKGFLYVGTACSFPAHMQTGVTAPPLKEEDQFPAAPESSYGWSKLMGEYEAFLMQEETGVPVCVPILHNAYGTPCDFGPEKSQVIPSLIRKAINYPNEEFVVWGSGKQGRAFVHNDDIVEGLVLALEKGLGQGRIQIGPDFCTTIQEVAETIVEISGKNIPIRYDESKPEGDRGRRADYSKARDILKWEPKISLKEGLTEIYNWVEKQYLCYKN